MKLSEGLSFNRKDVNIIGFTDLGKHTPSTQKNELGNHGLVFMFQPFQGKWVQTLGSFLSRGCASGEILHKLIIECIILLEDVGLYIDVVTTDGASWNRTMWKKFGLEKHMCSCHNPTDDNRRLWIASDFPHLIKCVRNRIVQQQNMTVRKLLICIFYIQGHKISNII